MVEHQASDLHLSAGARPMIRVDGELQVLMETPILQEDLVKILHGLMDKTQAQAFDARMEVDFAFEMTDLARFRVNGFQHAQGAGVVFRRIPSTIQTLHELALPPLFAEIAHCPQGLVLVTGPTGSGKSTTLAAMIQELNFTCRKHILTIEDPIEFVHQSQMCLITQREVHRDTQSFNTALRAALREDPDIILVGELRDLETIRLAITAAETGHLVLATLHTNSASKALNRLIDVFPGEEKVMIRALLAESLQAVIAQVLIKKPAGGRIAGYEVMICTPAIRHLIREGKVAQLYSAIQMGQAQGMQTLDQHLTTLVRSKRIDEVAAHEHAINKSLFKLPFVEQ